MRLQVGAELFRFLLTKLMFSLEFIVVLLVSLMGNQVSNGCG